MNFQNILQRTLKHEGTYSFHVSDKGGATMYGITEQVARTNGYKGGV